jgi:DEAD/DEAH box helicase domain-containing protein
MDALPSTFPSATRISPRRCPRHDGRELGQRLQAKYRDRITGAFLLPGAPRSTRPAARPAAGAGGGAEGARHRAAVQPPGRKLAAVREGQDVVIATPTASGKSLCYTLPVLADAMTKQARALYLFPTKALAQDQVAELLELNRAGKLGVKAFTFDGDTPGDARQAVRLHGEIVVSNPTCCTRRSCPTTPSGRSSSRTCNTW